ncbi:MAG: hypothetical protein AB7E72_14165 [Lysobacterales bacterium]
MTLLRLLPIAALALVATSTSAQVVDYPSWVAAGRPDATGVGAPVVSSRGTVVTTFNTRADWLTATGVLILENFDNGLTGPGGLNFCNSPMSSLSDDDCFEPGDLISGFQVTVGNNGTRGNLPLVVLGDGFIGQPTAVVGATTFADFTIVEFGEANVDAVAFNTFSGSGGGGRGTTGVTVRLYDAGDVLIDTLNYPTTAPNVAAFVGFVSPVPVARMEVEGVGGSGELIDGLAFGAQVQVANVAVPVGSFGFNAMLIGLLLALGLVFIGRQSMSLR